MFVTILLNVLLLFYVILEIISQTNQIKSVPVMFYTPSRTLRNTTVVHRHV